MADFRCSNLTKQALNLELSWSISTIEDPFVVLAIVTRGDNEPDKLASSSGSVRLGQSSIKSRLVEARLET